MRVKLSKVPRGYPLEIAVAYIKMAKRIAADPSEPEDKRKFFADVVARWKERRVEELPKCK
jgi:hypothetical protein